MAADEALFYQRVNTLAQICANRIDKLLQAANARDLTVEQRAAWITEDLRRFDEADVFVLYAEYFRGVVRGDERG